MFAEMERLSKQLGTYAKQAEKEIEEQKKLGKLLSNPSKETKKIKESNDVEEIKGEPKPEEQEETEDPQELVIANRNLRNQLASCQDEMKKVVLENMKLKMQKAANSKNPSKAAKSCKIIWGSKHCYIWITTWNNLEIITDI